MNKRIIKSDNPNIRLPYILIVPDNYDVDSSIVVDVKTPLSSSGNIDQIIDNMISIIQKERINKCYK